MADKAEFMPAGRRIQVERPARWQAGLKRMSLDAS
jgi:hypothetical protein